MARELDEDKFHASRLAKEVVGKQANPLTVFTWVIDNHLVSWRDIKPADVPSPGALSVLLHIKQSDKNYQNFLNKYANLLPPRSSLEADARHKDDGRGVLALLEAAEKEFYEGPTK